MANPTNISDLERVAIDASTKDGGGGAIRAGALQATQFQDASGVTLAGTRQAVVADPSLTAVNTTAPTSVASSLTGSTTCTGAATTDMNTNVDFILALAIDVASQRTQVIAMNVDIALYRTAVIALLDVLETNGLMASA